ncbi:hypothetical protein ACFQX4_20505 [Roseomonas sp. GCM10028921]
MIDYHANCAVLADFTATLAAETFTDPAMTQARDDALTALAAAPGGALLGAFVHHLFVHASSDGAELALLQRASDLWAKGTALYSALGRVRADIEGALVNSTAPGAAATFNNASVEAQHLANSAIALQGEVNALREDAIKYPHLPRHPRQRDASADMWDWGNLVLGRRTDAFVRFLLAGGTSKMSLAFALGAASSYGANVAGSAYLGQAVGGPRRLHRFRDRIARNASGAWLATNSPGGKTLAEMSGLVGTGAAAGLPTELARLLQDAGERAFRPRPSFPLPDLNLGYQRLVQHLVLLDGFELPPPPSMPPPTFVSSVMSGPSGSPPGLRPQDVDVSGQDGGGVAVGMGPDPQPGSQSPGSSDSATQKGCGILVLVIILIDVIQAFVQCCVQWGKKETCTFWENMLLEKVWEQDPPDPRDPSNPQATAQQLEAMAETPQMAEFLWMMFDTHCQIWEALARSREFLALTGLIYPRDLLTQPLYAQFTTLPFAGPWPHRETRKPEDNYVRFPTSPLEHPFGEPSPYGAGAHPDAILGQSRLRAADVGFRLWRQVAADQMDSENLDLDADRGFGHGCWTSRNSVMADPVDVVVLGYEDQ